MLSMIVFISLLLVELPPPPLDEEELDEELELLLDELEVVMLSV